MLAVFLPFPKAYDIVDVVYSLTWIILRPGILFWHYVSERPMLLLFAFSSTWLRQRRQVSRVICVPGHAKAMLGYKPTYDSATDDHPSTRLWRSRLASSTCCFSLHCLLPKDCEAFFSDDSISYFTDKMQIRTDNPRCFPQGDADERTDSRDMRCLQTLIKVLPSFLTYTVMPSPYSTRIRRMRKSALSKGIP